MTPGFSRLSVGGVRRLKLLDIALRPLNVLIGPNAVGKSTVLDIFRLLAASANGRLAATIAEMGSFPLLLTADGKMTDITLGVRISSGDASPVDYKLSLKGAGLSYSIEREYLTPRIPVASLFRPKATIGRTLGRGAPSTPRNPIDADGSRIRYFAGDKYVEPDWDYKWSETALSQTPRSDRDAESFRHALANVSEVYHSLDVSSRAPVRTPQTLAPTRTPGANGEDLVSCLFTMRETARERFDAVEDALRAAFPTMERLEFPPVAAGSLTLGWRESGYTRPFYASELSEGTLRFLWLATLLQSPGLPEITLIDEPEVSLHPEMLLLLTELMREATERTQLIVATHSDRFVRFLEPKELLVCDLDEAGGMTTQWADELDLRAWLEDYTLDQLWSKGILGGRS
jgi:predicted ATPase